MNNNVKAVNEVTAVTTATTARDEIIIARGNVLNDLAGLEKKWEILERISGKKFPLNWKKRSIKKVQAEKPELTETLNKCKEHLFTNLATLNTSLDKEELKKIKKERLDTFLSKEESLIKAARIDAKIINGDGDDTSLDVLLEAEKINREKIKEAQEILEKEKFQLRLEAIAFLKNL